MARERTYGMAAFAALAGVTPRALRYYERLGLLKPGRTASGYRRYVEGDLRSLQEIVALTFIGVPLKQIAGVRRGSNEPLALVLRAQRGALEAKRRAVTAAIDALTAAETLIHGGAGVDADALRRIIEVMQMEQQQEDALATYVQMLKAKVQHLQAMSGPERAALRREWDVLIDDVKAALGEDPAGPTAQRLLERWSVLFAQFTGAGGPAIEAASGHVLPPPALREALWTRRAEWMPEDASRAAHELQAGEALLAARRPGEGFVSADVLEFIGRARAARTAAEGGQGTA